MLSSTHLSFFLKFHTCPPSYSIHQVPLDCPFAALKFSTKILIFNLVRTHFSGLLLVCLLVVHCTLLNLTISISSDTPFQLINYIHPDDHINYIKDVIQYNPFQYPIACCVSIAVQY